MWNASDHHCDTTDAHRRLVCHACGQRYPIGYMACALRCCKTPEVHIHCMVHPCDMCKEGE